MITLRIPAPQGLSEQLAIVDLAEQLADSIPVEDERWMGAYRALIVARDAADDIRRGIPVWTWPQPEPVAVLDEPSECEGCGHWHYATEDCGEPGEGCGRYECCQS